MDRIKVQKSREFKITVGDKECALYIRRPNQRELFDIDISYRTAMTRLIEGGVMTIHKAAKLFDTGGEWTKLDEQDLKNVTIMLAHKSKLLEDERDKRSREENLKTVDEISRCRAEQMALIGRKTDLFSHCAERLAEEQKMHAMIISCCCRADDDCRLFTHVDEYQKFTKEQPEAASKLLVESYNFEYGMDPDQFGKDWAEVLYLQFLAAEESTKRAEKDEAVEKVDIPEELKVSN